MSETSAKEDTARHTEQWEIKDQGLGMHVIVVHRDQINLSFSFLLNDLESPKS